MTAKASPVPRTLLHLIFTPGRGRGRHARFMRALTVIIILLAATWFITRLTNDSLWLDEAWSLWAAEPTAPGDVLERVINDVHPPLYFLLLDPWISIAGDSELAARLPSVLMAFVCMALVYRLGADWFSARAGVAAALVLGTSSFFAYYAHEARMYMLVALTTTASMLVYGRWLRRNNARTRWLYLGVALALLYTHYFGVLVLLVQGVHYWMIRRRAAPKKAWFFLVLGIGAAYVPWLPFLFWQVNFRPGGLMQAIPTDPVQIKLLAKLLSNGEWLMFGALGALAVLVWLRDLHKRAWVGLVLLWAGLPLALTLAVNLEFPIYTPRNIFMVMPGVALLVGAGLGRLRWLPWLVLVALIARPGPAARHALLPDRFPWRGFVADMSAHFEPGEPVLLHVGEHLFTLPFRYYFLHQWPGEPEPLSLFTMPMPPQGEAFEQAVRGAIEGHARVWLVSEWPTPRVSFAAHYLKEVRRSARMVSAFGMGGYLFAPPPQDPGRAVYYFGAGHLAVRHDLDDRVYEPGETVDLVLNWSRQGSPEGDYAAAVRLVSRGEQVVAANDGLLAGEMSFSDPRPLALPRDLPPGTYSIRVFLYTEPDTPALEAGDEAGLRVGWVLVLRTIEVVQGG